jgi:hypothetical protein
MLQLSYSLNALIEAKASPWLATTTTPCSSLPCHCQPLALLLPLHDVPLSCMQLLSYQACHLLPSISSPAPCPHCIPCCQSFFLFRFIDDHDSLPRMNPAITLMHTSILFSWIPHRWGGKHCLHQKHVSHQFFCVINPSIYWQTNKLL